MIDRTYGHIAADAEDQDRGLLDPTTRPPSTALARRGHGIGGQRRGVSGNLPIPVWSQAGSNRRPPACKSGDHHGAAT